MGFFEAYVFIRILIFFDVELKKYLRYHECSNELKKTVTPFIFFFREWYCKMGDVRRSQLNETQAKDISLLFEDFEGYCRDKTRQLRVRERRYRDIVKFARRQAEIIIFGAGDLGSGIYCYLRRCDTDNVVAFCDNDESRQGKRFLDRELLLPGVAVARYPKAAYIVSSARYGLDIAFQLIAMGIDPMKIYLNLDMNMWDASELPTLKI
jgi:hypothetical protein